MEIQEIQRRAIAALAGKYYTSRTLNKDYI